MESFGMYKSQRGAPPIRALLEGVVRAATLTEVEVGPRCAVTSSAVLDHVAINEDVNMSPPMA